MTKRKLQTAVIKLDRGENDKCLNEFCNLAYLSGLAVPKLPHNPDRRAAEEWVKMEVYMNSLEAQVEIANSARIYECNASRTCDAIFSNLEQAEYHRVTKHQMMNYGYSQNLHGSGAYYEQGNLMKRPWIFSDSSNRSTEGINTHLVGHTGRLSLQHGSV